MNILAVDFGTKNIGLAWTDTGMGVILPFGVINEKTVEQKIQALVKVIVTEKIQKVVVGLPIGLNGGDNANMARVKAFGDDLQKNISIPVDFYDERFSSQQADRMGGDASRDEKSAMIILEDYVAREKLN